LRNPLRRSAPENQRSTTTWLFRSVVRAGVALLAGIGLFSVLIVIANAREPYGGPFEA
jgi:hypothetical protein